VGGLLIVALTGLATPAATLVGFWTAELAARSMPSCWRWPRAR